jgi:hypothetical protein
LLKSLIAAKSRPKLVMVMTTKEGTHRIHLLAKRIMLFGSLAGIAIWVLMFILRGGGGLADLFILIAVPLACGATLWLIAWIMEGFMTSSADK